MRTLTRRPRAADPLDPLLLSDPRVASVPLRECGEPLVRLDGRFGPGHALVRRGLAERLEAARSALPTGIGMRVVEGYRAPAAQQAIITSYAEEVRAAHPTAGEEERHHLTSRFVAPLAVAPHVAGAAVDLTLVESRTGRLLDRARERSRDRVLDLGTPIDATPEQSGGRCFFASPAIPAEARALREVLAGALGGSGLVNYPTEWWHWSYGDRYWAVVTGAGAAVYGPVAA